LIALNKSNRQSLISARIGKESKYVEIRPGFDSISVDSKEVAKKSLGLDPSIFIIGYVGRFEKIKRIDLLSEVIALSTTKFPNVQFITFGNGPEFKQFHERTKHFSVLNFSWIDDLKIAYSVIDLLILVSDNIRWGYGLYYRQFNRRNSLEIRIYSEYSRDLCESLKSSEETVQLKLQ
jgi:glycosyltransferase involved in cell wall biosynthesis